MMMFKQVSGASKATLRFSFCAASSALEEYEHLGKEVFGRPVGGQLGRVVRGITGSPFYNIANLQNAIQFVIKKRGIPPDNKSEPSCKVILYATRIESGKADILRNYESCHPTAENYDCRIWEAASATAAAPMYFKAIKFAASGERWCDGAIRRNNPINEALAELAREPEWQNKKIGCILNLGTGLARSRSVSSNLAGFLKGALKMLTDAEDTAKVFSASALGRELAQTHRYFRFNVPHGMEDLQIDEWKETERMKAMTTEYLSHTDNGDSIMRCAKTLLYPDENSFFSPQMRRGQIFALWGLGGTGKTQIALDFSQSMKDRLSIFWIRADNLGNFIADYSRVLPLLNPELDGLSPQEVMLSLLARTRDKLEELAGDWLLILDNADHLNDFIGVPDKDGPRISKYVPRRGRILITTRDRRFQGLAAAASDGLCVEPMIRLEAKDLLLKYVPNHLVRPSAVNTLMADDLVEKLGCLSLAQMSFAEYVGLFREKRRRLDLMASLAYDFANKDVRNGISSSPLSVTFLQYLACFYWRETPQILLRRLPEFHDLDDVSFLQVTKRPLALSLIDQTLDEDPRLSSYSVHPVLHKVMTAELSIEDKRRMLSHLTPIISSVFPTVPAPATESWPWRRFHSHSSMFNAAADMADAALSMASQLIGPENELRHYFRRNAIERLNDAGRYDRAEAECSLALELLEARAATTSLDTKAYNKEKVLLLDYLSIALRDRLGYGMLESIYKEQLHCQQAEQWSAEDVVEKRLHLIMLNLRALIMRTGDDVWQNLDQVIALYERVLHETLSVVGIDDKETWIALNNRLGSLSQALRMNEIHQTATMYLNHHLAREGPVKGARAAEFAELLDRWSYVSGIEDVIKSGSINRLSHLNSLNSYGVYLQYHGRYEEAVTVHRKVIRQLEGRDDGLGRLSHCNFMLALAKAGREDEALAFRREHKELIMPMEAVYGTLEQRQEERKKEMRVYEEAKSRIERKSLCQQDQWWLDNATTVRRVGLRLDHDLVPLP
ncbi:uncharacterized protein B0T15DRAFT_484941 [Chaetomium strumarium]|uniref:PNPLA domain-containing protein n=1 Tax=Chaetomium strumarium TaxID=1170767 RepID=A0AAJ0GSI4_9PEZI|nr:hypothetical protein B0T15DRAFT_484941 [Chaetomium strumarium]